MKAVTQHLRLPFRRHTWKGLAGNWLGVGIGSSIDFQDHRPYLPGDDPRYIDWQAYARTGHYTMKLYREEVSPHVDILFDASPSMAVDEAKQRRTIELLYFAIESALQTSATVQCVAFHRQAWSVVPLPALLAHQSPTAPRGGPPRFEFPDLNQMPLRHGSLRVFLSDLLYPGAPEEVLRPLRGRRGRAIILAPFAAVEENPSWSGNVELIDCESLDRRKQQVVPDILRRYREAYDRHFELWSDVARKHDVVLARIPAARDLLTGLRGDALSRGAVETWN